MGGAESMVTLQERLVNLINQLNMPIIETSMVISRWTNKLLKELMQHTNEVPSNLLNQWLFNFVEFTKNFSLNTTS